MVVHLRDFLVRLDDAQTAFRRELSGAAPQWGHVTGSAWVINEVGSRVVLVHHAKLNRWVQPGGHCDGEADVRAVARREAHEETGLIVTPLPHDLAASGCVAGGIFDVDVHPIPEYWNTPEHMHYDVRFVFTADERAAPIVSAESHAVRWVALEEAAALSGSASIRRMIAKTRVLFAPTFAARCSG